MYCLHNPLTKAFKYTILSMTFTFNDLNIQGQICEFCLIFANICYNFVICQWVVFILGHNKPYGYVFKLTRLTLTYIHKWQWPWIFCCCYCWYFLSMNKLFSYNTLILNNKTFMLLWDGFCLGSILALRNSIFFIV